MKYIFKYEEKASLFSAINEVCIKWFEWESSVLCRIVSPEWRMLKQVHVISRTKCWRLK